MGGKLREFCTVCKRPFTREEQIKRLQAKKENANSSRAKAIANGNRCGRKKTGDAALIIRLRKEGRTFREIASMAGVSTTAVQRRLNEAKKQPTGKGEQE